MPGQTGERVFLFAPFGWLAWLDPTNPESARRAGCQVAVEFRDPDNHLVEFYWDLEQVGTTGAVRPPEDWRETFTLEEATNNPPPGQDTTLAGPSLRED